MTLLQFLGGYDVVYNELENSLKPPEEQSLLPHHPHLHIRVEVESGRVPTPMTGDRVPDYYRNRSAAYLNITGSCRRLSPIAIFEYRGQQDLLLLFGGHEKGIQDVVTDFFTKRFSGLVVRIESASPIYYNYPIKTLKYTKDAPPDSTIKAKALFYLTYDSALAPYRNAFREGSVGYQKINIIAKKDLSPGNYKIWQAMAKLMVAEDEARSTPTNPTIRAVRNQDYENIVFSESPITNFVPRFTSDTLEDTD